MQGKQSDADYVDYIMAERFGLDWWKEDARRMARFISIMRFEGEEQKKKNNKTGTDQKKFRPRGMR